MIKRILVGVDGSEHSGAALRYAVWLGKRLDATVSGLHVVDIVSIEGSFFHDISGSLGFEPYLDFTAKMRAALQERGRGLLEEFERQCDAARTRHDSRLTIGVVASDLCDGAREADLLVIGYRGANARFTTGLLGSVTESATRQCTRPVLVTPAEFQEIRSPMLAWDGSERASGAMRAAADLCTALALPLAVVTIARDAEDGEAIIAHARRYLSSYAIAVDYKVEVGQAWEQIPLRLREGGHDLVFMGSHGHSRIVEWVLGSTTEFVLRNAHCPVFLSR